MRKKTKTLLGIAAVTTAFACMAFAVNSQSVSEDDHAVEGNEISAVEESAMIQPCRTDYFESCNNRGFKCVRNDALPYSPACFAEEQNGCNLYVPCP